MIGDMYKNSILYKKKKLTEDDEFMRFFALKYHKELGYTIAYIVLFYISVFVVSLIVGAYLAYNYMFR